MPPCAGLWRGGVAHSDYLKGGTGVRSHVGTAGRALSGKGRSRDGPRSISAGQSKFPVGESEPGMPTLPAELFEKVQALAPGSPLRENLHRRLTPMPDRPWNRNLSPRSWRGSNRSRRSQNRRPWSWPKSRWWRVRSDWWMPRRSCCGMHPRCPCRRTSRPAAVEPPVEAPALCFTPRLSPSLRWRSPLFRPSGDRGCGNLLRLGMAYKDMGLWDEAKEEFCCR